MRKVIPVCLMVCICGCEAIKNYSEIYGSYELTSRDGKILLEVVADHSYSESIRFSGRPDQKNSGHWQWRDGRVCFNALLVPRSLMKVYENANRKSFQRLLETHTSWITSYRQGKNTARRYLR